MRCTNVALKIRGSCNWMIIVMLIPGTNPELVEIDKQTPRIR